MNGFLRIFERMEVTRIIWNFFFWGLTVLLLTGCESLSHRDGKMEEIAGQYKLSSVEQSGSPSLPSFLSSSLTAEIYEVDGKWYFDATYPILNYHQVYEYHKFIFPVTWDQVLCKYLFYDYPSEQDRTGIQEILFKDGQIQVIINDFGHSVVYVWSK